MLSVKCAKSRLNLVFPPMDGGATRSNNSLLIKINIFIWRLVLNRLLTKSNLDYRGIELPLILCPYCGEVQEDGVH